MDVSAFFFIRISSWVHVLTYLDKVNDKSLHESVWLMDPFLFILILAIVEFVVLIVGPFQNAGVPHVCHQLQSKEGTLLFHGSLPRSFLVFLILKTRTLIECKQYTFTTPRRNQGLRSWQNHENSHLVNAFSTPFNVQILGEKCLCL